MLFELKPNTLKILLQYILIALMPVATGHRGENKP
jgi:hypothetical protein